MSKNQPTKNRTTIPPRYLSAEEMASNHSGDRPKRYPLAAPRPVKSPLGNTADSVNCENGLSAIFVEIIHGNDAKTRQTSGFARAANANGAGSFFAACAIFHCPIMAETANQRAPIAATPHNFRRSSSGPPLTRRYSPDRQAASAGRRHHCRESGASTG